MGLKHEAKKGTVIEVSGQGRLTIIRGSALVEIDAPPEVAVTITQSIAKQSARSQNAPEKLPPLRNFKNEREAEA